MKKVVGIVLAALTIVSINSFQVHAKDGNLRLQKDIKSTSEKTIINSKDEVVINKLIKTYFDSNLESIKQLKPINLLGQSVSDEFKKYNDLNNKYYAEWYKKVNKQLNSYNIQIKQNDLSIKNNKYYINSTVKVEMNFKDSIDIKQTTINNYDIVISKIGEKLLLEDVILKDEKDNENILTGYLQINEDSLNNRYSKLEENFANIDSNYKVFKNTLSKDRRDNGGRVKRSDSYDYLAAVDYAHAWANGYNPNYRSWKNNDCTNFVSQCLVAGGKSMVEPTWAYSSFTQSRSWLIVDEFRDAMLDLGYGTPYNSSNYSGHVGRGDILQFFNKKSSTWSHSTIITKMDSYGTIFYSCHSGPRLDYGLYNVYPNHDYSDIRFISIN